MVARKMKVADALGQEKLVTDPDAPRNMVSVRSAGGKGSKPMTVRRGAAFESVVAALETIVSDLDDHVATAWQGYRAKVASGEIPDTASAPEVEDSE